MNEILLAYRLMEQPNAVFVFGSNLAGAHGAGAALVAREKYGAILGMGRGFAGRSYALPTKDEQLNTRKLIDLIEDIRLFKSYADVHDDRLFVVTAVGCGLAGFTKEQIVPHFKKSPGNCVFTNQEWVEML